MESDSVADRVAALERQVAALAARLDAPPAPPAPAAVTAPAAPAAAGSDDVYWALNGLRARVGGAPGAVLFTGTVDLPTGEHYEWQYGTAVADLLGADWADLAGTLAALGHPVRLALLHRILSGTHGAAELAEGTGLGTTGQLYHHLRQLVAAGWLRSSARGRYAVPGDRVVPLLVILSGVRR